jgi:hypothetical protein
MRSSTSLSGVLLHGLPNYDLLNCGRLSCGLRSYAIRNCRGNSRPNCHATELNSCPDHRTTGCCTIARSSHDRRMNLHTAKIHTTGHRTTSLHKSGRNNLRGSPNLSSYATNRKARPHYAHSWRTGLPRFPPVDAEPTATSTTPSCSWWMKVPHMTACCSAADEERPDSWPFATARFAIELAKHCPWDARPCRRGSNSPYSAEAGERSVQPVMALTASVSAGHVVSTILHSARSKSHRAPQPSDWPLPLTTLPAASCG